MDAGATPEVAAGMPPAGTELSTAWIKYLGEYPGSWECNLRSKAKVIRKFFFHVNDKGFVDPDPSRAGELTLPNVVPVAMQFGPDAEDIRVRPDAMKKSAGFGRPWPKGPPKNLPAKASGLPDPK